MQYFITETIKVPLDAISGVFFGGIVLEGSEFFLFSSEDQLSMFIPE